MKELSPLKQILLCNRPIESILIFAIVSHSIQHNPCQRWTSKTDTVSGLGASRRAPIWSTHDLEMGTPDDELAKKNPSDPDAVVTADAGVVWLMATESSVRYAATAYPQSYQSYASTRAVHRKA